MYQYKFKTDIVIPVRNAPLYVVRCIESVMKHTNSFKFIFVDDESKPETSYYLQGIQRAFPSTIIIRTGFQKWFTRASNLGLRLVQTQFTCLLNSDCEVHENWLEELYWVWEDMKTQGRNPGLIGSVTSHEEGRRWCETSEPNYITGHCLFFDINQMRNIVRDQFGRDLEILDHRTIEQAHINSERLLCYDLNRIGFHTAVSYKSWVDHEAGKSWGHDLFGLYNAIKDINDLD